jgi:hypothetical protein
LGVPVPGGAPVQAVSRPFRGRFSPKTRVVDQNSAVSRQKAKTVSPKGFFSLTKGEGLTNAHGPKHTR